MKHCDHSCMYVQIYKKSIVGHEFTLTSKFNMCGSYLKSFRLFSSYSNQARDIPVERVGQQKPQFGLEPLSVRY